jgi:hypothetical protein
MEADFFSGTGDGGGRMASATWTSCFAIITGGVGMARVVYGFVVCPKDFVVGCARLAGLALISLATGSTMWVGAITRLTCMGAATVEE